MQGGRAADVEVEYLGPRLVADGEQVSEASRHEESDLQGDEQCYFNL